MSNPLKVEADLIRWCEGNLGALSYVMYMLSNDSVSSVDVFNIYYKLTKCETIGYRYGNVILTT